METSATALANLTRRSCKSFQTFVKLSVKIAEFSNESCRDHRLAERREKVESSSPVDCSSQAGGQWSRGKRRSTVRHHYTRLERRSMPSCTAGCTTACTTGCTAGFARLAAK